MIEKRFHVFLIERGEEWGENNPVPALPSCCHSRAPLRAATAAKPGSIKMKSSVSGFLWNEPAVPGEAWRDERDEGLLELGHLFETVDASGNGKAAARTDEGCP